MSTSIEALKQAVQHERDALAQYKIALEHTPNQETKDALKDYIADKEQKIDTLSWFVMAETGTLEKEEAPAKTGASKCPFSGQLAEMGIDISQMKPPTFD